MEVGEDAATATGTAELRARAPRINADRVDLRVTCDNGDERQQRVDVEGAELVAVLQGLRAGSCQVELVATADDGTRCVGTGRFTIAPGGQVEVEVELECSDPAPIDDDGGVEVRAEFNLTPLACDDDRILKIFAIPGVLPVGESTTVEVESYNLAGDADILFEDLDPDVVHLAFATQGQGCQGASSDCIHVSCRDEGVAAVEVILVDSFTTSEGMTGTCTDRETIWIECRSGEAGL